MGTEFAWFYDVALVGVIIAFIYIGGKRGFLRTIIMLVGYIIAIIGGSLISKEISPIIYKNYLQEKTQKVVEKNIEDINIKEIIRKILKEQNVNIEIPDSDIDKIIKENDDLAEGFSSYAANAGEIGTAVDINTRLKDAFNTQTILDKIEDKIPNKAFLVIKEYLEGSSDKISEVIRSLNNSSKKTAAEELTETVVEPVVITVIQLLVFMIVFSLIMILIRILSRFFSKIYLIPIAGSINTLLGAILGCVQGVFIILIVTVLFKVIIAVTKNELIVINTPTIEETNIFKEIYDLDLFM